MPSKNDKSDKYIKKETKSGYSRVMELINLYEGNKGARTNFETYWQSLHDYFYIEATNVNREYYPGTELNVDALYDSTTLEAGDVLASGFMNYLTPPNTKWFGLKSRNEEYKDNKRVSTYFENVVDEVNFALNRSNFYNQMNSAYKSSGVYGTSILLEEEDIKDDIRFYTVPIKNVCLIEDAVGRIKSYFIEFEFTAKQAVDKFGAEKLSQFATARGSK